MAVSLGKIIFIVAIIDIVFIIAAGFSGVTIANDQLTILRSYVITDLDTNTTDLNESLTANLGLTSNQTGSSARVGISTVIFNTLFIVWNVIVLIGSYLLAPIAYMKAIGAPFYAILLVGAPMIVLMAIALVQFIRGYNM